MALVQGPVTLPQSKEPDFKDLKQGGCQEGKNYMVQAKHNTSVSGFILSISSMSHMDIVEDSVSEGIKLFPSITAKPISTK